MIKSVYDVINHYVEQSRIEKDIALSCVNIPEDAIKSTPCALVTEFLIDSMSIAHCGLDVTATPDDEMDIVDRIESDARNTVDTASLYWRNMGWHTGIVSYDGVRKVVSQYLYSCLVQRMRRALYGNGEFYARVRQVLEIQSLGSTKLIEDVIYALPLRDLDDISDNDISTAYANATLGDESEHFGS